MSSDLHLCYYISIVLEPSSKPGKPEVADSDFNFIIVQWKAPEKDGGSPVTGYLVERKDPATNRWTKITTDPISVRPREGEIGFMI